MKVLPELKNQICIYILIYDTFEILPFRPHQGKVARMICDVYKPDGTQLENDPRYILKKVLKEAEDMGYEFNVGPECEFFLFHTDDYGNPTTISHEKGSYFDLGPTDLGENARRDMVLNLEEMGFEVEASHHEVAPAQHEIDFKYGEALETADKIMTYKLTVKTIAKRHGLYASFMPKQNTECAVQECILICLYLTKKDRIFSLMKMTKTDLAKKLTTL